MKMKRIDTNAPIELVPKLSANSFFHFMNERQFLYTALVKKALFPRYCKEDISYLGLSIEDNGIDEVAYPEKCFCDIPLHEVCSHVNTYGKFGIGLKKSWGIKAGLQPIQYVNPDSSLVADFKTAFYASLKSENADNNIEKVKDFLVSYMLFIKPVTGTNENRISGQLEEKYFTDECEWRYVPNLSKKEMEVILFGNAIYKNADGHTPLIEKYNIALGKLEDVWLRFEYSDLKYITVQNDIEKKLLIKFISSMDNGTDEMEKLDLISKIIVFDSVQEDF